MKLQKKRTMAIILAAIMCIMAVIPNMAVLAEDVTDYIVNEDLFFEEDEVIYEENSFGEMADIVSEDGEEIKAGEQEAALADTAETDLFEELDEETEEIFFETDVYADPEDIALTLDNQISMFSPQSAVLRKTGDELIIVLTMGSDSYDQLYVGNSAEVESAHEEEISLLAEGNVFTFDAGTLTGEGGIVSFRSAKKGYWYERKLTLDTEEAKLTFVDGIKADYTELEQVFAEAKALDLTQYTEESAGKVETALQAVPVTKSGAVDKVYYASNQNKVNALAEAITDAVNSLVKAAVEEPFDNSTTLADGEYEIEDFGFQGGTGKTKFSAETVSVRGGKAYAVLTTTSGSMTHVYLGHTESDADDPAIYNPETGAKSINTYVIENKQVEVPVRISEQVEFAGRTTAMSAPHWVQYSYQITLKVDKEAADAVSQMLDALKADSGLEDKAAVEEARAAYDALTDAQKALVDPSALGNLKAAEESVKKAEEAAKKAAEEAAKKAAEEAAKKAAEEAAKKAAEQAAPPAAGTVLTDGTANYVVETPGSTVAYQGPVSKKVKKVVVPNTVAIDGVTYTVDSIAPNAFRNCKNLTNATIPSNITSIGANAFAGTKNLKNVTIKSKQIKKIGKKAFYKSGSKNYKKLKVKVPKSKLKAYRKLLKNAKLSSKAKVTK